MTESNDSQVETTDRGGGWFFYYVMAPACVVGGLLVGADLATSGKPGVAVFLLSMCWVMALFSVMLGDTEGWDHV